MRVVPVFTKCVLSPKVRKKKLIVYSSYLDPQYLYTLGYRRHPYSDDTKKKKKSTTTHDRKEKWQNLGCLLYLLWQSVFPLLAVCSVFMYDCFFRFFFFIRSQKFQLLCAVVMCASSESLRSYFVYYLCSPPL